MNALLLDLDGTVLDTAPDFEWALNRLLQQQQRPLTTLNQIRNQVTHGVRGLVGHVFGYDRADESQHFAELRAQFLAIYAECLGRKATLFSGMEAFILWLNQHAVPWGIVTNKPQTLTQTLLRHFDILQTAGCVVAPDGKLNSKPEPDMLLQAAARLDCDPADCLYVGDAEKDVVAAKRAGMLTAVALYGYISETENPRTWGADHWVSGTSDLQQLWQRSAGIDETTRG